MKICRPRPQLVFTFDNRFSSIGCAAQQSVRYIIFRLQASYLSATSHTGRKSCRVKSLNMKRFWSWVISVYLFAGRWAKELSKYWLCSPPIVQTSWGIYSIYNTYNTLATKDIYAAHYRRLGGGGVVRTLELKGSMCQIMGRESQACWGPERVP